MKGSKSLRFVVFVYDVNGRVVVDKTGKHDESYADFLECLPKNEVNYYSHILLGQICRIRFSLHHQ